VKREREANGRRFGDLDEAGADGLAAQAEDRSAWG